MIYIKKSQIFLKSTKCEINAEDFPAIFSEIIEYIFRHNQRNIFGRVGSLKGNVVFFGLLKIETNKQQLFKKICTGHRARCANIAPVYTLIYWLVWYSICWANRKHYENLESVSSFRPSYDLWHSCHYIALNWTAITVKHQRMLVDCINLSLYLTDYDFETKKCHSQLKKSLEARSIRWPESSQNISWYVNALSMMKLEQHSLFSVNLFAAFCR